MNRSLAATLALLLLTPLSRAAVFSVPSDRDLIDQSAVILRGRVISSQAAITREGMIETTIRLSPTEMFKSPDSFAMSTDGGVDFVELVDPGGVSGSKAVFIPESARYEPGEDVLVFLGQDGISRWTTWGMTLGKFSFQKVEDADLVVRGGESPIPGFNPDGSEHVERPRLAESFLNYIRATVAGGNPPADYFFQEPREHPVRSASEPPTSSGRETVSSQSSVRPIVPNATYPPSAYLLGPARWQIFDQGGSATFRVSGQQPGFDGIGIAQRALAAWTNDPQSNVRYVYGGTTTAGFVEDGTNAIVYNSPTDVPAGAIAYSRYFAGAQHTYKGEVFYAIYEGDVVVKSGLNVSPAVMEEAVTHEVGHTLGFRHSNEGTPASSAAVMNSVVYGNYGSNLQPWDREALSVVYTETAVTPPPSGPPPGSTFTATPNPIETCDGSGKAATTLSWNFPGIAVVEIHLGSPSGPIFSRGGSSGSAATGKWVTNGMVFYAQNVTGGLPLTAANTLLTTTVSLTCSTPNFWLTPNPSSICDGSGLSVVTLHWNFPGAQIVEFHLGAPNGPIFARAGSSGSVSTGKWVRDGTVFYAQNVSSGAAPSSSNTIATATARVMCFQANPNPISVCDGSGLGATTLQWSFPWAQTVEIHLGGPSGPIFARSGSTGSATTGKWVRNGTSFFAQNVAGGLPLNSANTLGVVNVTVRCP